jgi:uncharacterized membrane protein YczE
MITSTPEAAPVAARGTARLRYAGQLVVLFAGLLLFALGSACTWKAHIGLGPWECFHLGLSLHAPITQGQASILTGAGVIGLSLFLGVRPGVATICNMIFVGLFFDAWNTILPDLGGADLLSRVALDVAGVLIIGIGSGLYIRAKLGAGPRDSLMLALARRSGGRIAVVRGAVELSALAFGFLLGGPVGAGTLIHALGVGPAVEIGFRLFRVETRH